MLKEGHTLLFSRNNFSGTIRTTRAFRKSAYTSVALLSLLILAILCPISFRSATPTEAVSGTPKQSTLTFTSTTNNASVSLDLTGASATSGTFATSSNNEKASFSLTTDNYTGYELFLKSSSSTTTLSNGTNTINTISSDGITSSQFTTNTWGLLPSKYNCTTSSCSENTTNYYRPTTAGFLMEQTSSANSTAKEYTVGLGLKADYTMSAGTYTSSAIIAEYVARPISYSIAYDKGNITGTPTNIPSTQSDLVSSTSVTLSSATPSITGYTFTGWCLGTVSTNTTTKVDSCTGTNAKTFQPGGSFGIDQTTSNDVTLHAMWSAIPRTITITAGTGISTLTASGWTGTGTNTITKTYYIGDTINLTTITPATKTGYTGTAYALTSGSGSISVSTYTVGNGNGTITIKATGLNTPTCTIQGGTTKVYNRSATTLTATDNSNDYDTSSVDITYSFGYATSGTADLGNFSTAQTGITFSVTAAAFRGARYYGVKVVVADKTDSSITNTCTSGTVDAAVTGTNVDNRTTMTLVNSRINFDATTNGGTLSGTSPVYVYYNGTATYSSRTGTTARAIPTATKSGYNFTGWWTAASGGSKVINADGTLTGVAVSGWTNASSKWVKTGTSNSASAAANQLYAQFEVECTTATYMQNLTSSSIAAKLPSIGSTTDVCDSRDEQQYTIVKLADGNYWMAKNLNLAGGTTLSNVDTNVPANYSTSTAGFINGNTLPASSNSFSNSSATVYNSGSTTCASGKPCYSYYSWLAATAGYNATSDGTDVQYDICPKGWRMPTKTELVTLMNIYPTAADLNAAPFSASPAGWYSDSSLNAGGDRITYWSSTAYSNRDAWALHTYLNGSGTVNVSGYSWWKSTGNSVRCVFNMNYMQDQTSSSLAALMPNTGDTTELVDNRDGEVYTVGKLSDDRYWMLDNLALGSTSAITLDSTNTNLPSGSTWTLPKSGSKCFTLNSCTGTDGTTTGTGYTVPAINIDSKDIIPSNAPSGGFGSNKVGVYYNYCAASAGNICADRDSNTVDGSPDRDICPRGWRMPTGNTPGEYNLLYTNSALGSNAANYRNALSLPLSGMFYDGSNHDQDAYGRFWSSTMLNGSFMYTLNLSSPSGVEPYSNLNRFVGGSVRCIFK